MEKSVCSVSSVYLYLQEWVKLNQINLKLKKHYLLILSTKRWINVATFSYETSYLYDFQSSIIKHFCVISTKSDWKYKEIWVSIIDSSV